VTLRLAQFLAELAYDVKFQARVFTESGFKGRHWYPMSAHGGHRLGGIYIASFLGQPDQIVGEQKSDDMPSRIRQGSIGLYHAGDDVEDGVSTIPFPIDLFSSPEADNRRDDGYLGAFFIREQIPRIAARGTPERVGGNGWPALGGTAVRVRVSLVHFGLLRHCVSLEFLAEGCLEKSSLTLIQIKFCVDGAVAFQALLRQK
jgi:hypothetical protein